MSKSSWSFEAWDAGVSARAYNFDWWATLTAEKEPELWEAMRSIFEEERRIPEIPGWASSIVVRMMHLPMCGYYGYPANITQIIDAISVQKCPEVHWNSGHMQYPTYFGMRRCVYENEEVVNSQEAFRYGFQA